MKKIVHLLIMSLFLFNAAGIVGEQISASLDVPCAYDFCMAEEAGIQGEKSITKPSMPFLQVFAGQGVEYKKIFSSEIEYPPNINS